MITNTWMMLPPFEPPSHCRAIKEKILKMKKKWHKFLENLGLFLDLKICNAFVKSVYQQRYFLLT